jgi:hypothetical protein
MKVRLKTNGFGYITTDIPKTDNKGNKIVAAIYKVRDDEKGTFAVVGLYTWNNRLKSYSELWKNKIVRIKSKKDKN